MANETRKPAETPDVAKMADFYSGIWDTALNFQRQWTNVWMKPFGHTPNPDQMWQQWHLVSTEWLNHARRTTELANDFVGDQVKTAREFSDKSLELTRQLTKKEPKDLAPDFARECFDVTRRGAERTFEFGTDSMRAAEELGLRVAETVARVPSAK